MTTESKPFCGKCGARRVDASDKFCSDCGTSYPGGTAASPAPSTASVMGGTRGKTTPEWMKRKIRSIAVFIYENQNSTGDVDWKEIQAELQTYMEETRQNRNDERSPYWIELHDVPKASTLYKEIMDEITYPVADKDNVWSLGIHSVNGLPDDSVGACMQVWKRSLLGLNSRTPFSVKTARWVSKLRWVEQAGGSVSGAVTDVEKLWLTASLYAGREKHVEAVDDKKGMRSPILDIEIMFDETELKITKDLGLLDEWATRDDTVDILSELRNLAPEAVGTIDEEAKALEAMGDLPEDAVEFIHQLAEILRKVNAAVLDTFGAEGDSQREKAKGLIAIVTGAIYLDPRWEAIVENGGSFYVLNDVLIDMRNAQDRDNEKAAQGEERDQLANWNARASVDDILNGYQSFTIELLKEKAREHAAKKLIDAAMKAT
jgi:hypothetical protein